MWIQVRSMDGSKSIRVDDLSKLTRIDELRNRLVEKFDVTPDRQRLFYRGKQLENGYTLFDYDVGLNDIIQIIIRAPASEERKSEDAASSSGDESTSSNKENKLETPSVSGTSENSNYYKVGDLVDARDLTNGAWFEAKIVKIVCKSCPDDKTKSPTCGSKRQLRKNINDNNCDVPNSMKCNHGSKKSDNFIYYVTFETYDDEPTALSFKDIRPRARTVLKLKDVKKGSIVMANHNLEEPNERGYWYDCKVKQKTNRELIGTLYIDSDSTPVENCHIIFLDEIFKIEQPVMISQRSVEEEQLMLEGSPVKRQNKPECSFCNDQPKRKCTHCACHVCGGKDSPDKQVLCDECDMAYHTWCLDPPLETVPDDDDWYCPDCKNDETEVVRAGEKLKESKKKARMASANSSTKRDWGKGMACVGRTKECTIVPPNHFGAVPGIEVGTMWKFRVQVSEAGIHRPHVAGIHGRETDGAFSIVLSGGYEDDVDDGEQFTYTGSGGRDLSGNKRTAEQSCDQTLTRMNKALASNCAASLNKAGAEAKNWKEGRPVRVVRNCKGRKHSEYCPEEGNRYDGLYKVVKYWPETGKSGFLVWRYLLRRDDPAPAPWTKQGKKRAKELGLAMQYPEGYLQSAEEKKENVDNSYKRKGKREREDTPSPNPKKAKVLPYSLPPEIRKLIDKDENNKKIWEECLECLPEGKPNFLKRVEELFSCICCQEVVFDPVTTECCHNICKSCLQRSFKAEVYNCPMCRNDLGKDYVITANKNLNKVLSDFFPGYEAGR